MSDKKNNYSLDEILNNIRLEREQKAGIVPSEADTHISLPTEPVAKPEPKPTVPQRKFDDSVEDLVAAYLTQDEIEQSKRDVQQLEKAPAQAHKSKQRIEKKPEESKEEPKNESDDSFDLKALFSDEPEEKKTDDKQAEQERIRKRRKRINEFRKFTEKMQDEALLDVESRQQKDARIKAEIYDNIKPKDGEDLFHAVDEIEVRHKKRQSVKFNLPLSPAKIAAEKAKQENLNKTVLSAKEQKKQLTDTKQKAIISSLLSGSIAGVLLILAILPRFYTPGGFLESFIGGTGRIYLGVNLSIIVLAIVVSFDALRSSIVSIIKLSPNSDTCVLIAILFATLHNLALMFKGGFVEYGGVLYNCAAAFALFFNSLTKLFATTRILGNLTVLAKSNALRSVQTIENRADANQLAHGLSIDGRPGILYSTESQLPERFAALSHGRKGEEQFFTYAIPIILIVSVLAGICGAVASKNIIGFITSYTGCLCICLPIGMTFISNFLIMRTNSNLNKSGSVILGFDTTDKLETANAVIMDSKDMVFAEVSNFHNIKTHYDMSVEDAVTYTGAVITKGRGVLADVFEDIVKQLKIDLPAVEDLKYEDKLGFSAWVNSVKVLVGNSDMMTQHNVELPPVTADEYDDGRTTIYVALEGHLAAAFNVIYHIGKNAAKQIRRLSKNGVTLMLLTKDPGITEAFVAKRASVSADSIKIANSKSREIMRMYRGTGPRKKDSNLIYKPSPGSLLKLVNAAYRLIDADRQASIIQVIGLLFAAGICFAVNLLGTSHIINSLSIVIYQLIWGLLACIIAGRTLNNY